MTFFLDANVLIYSAAPDTARGHASRRSCGRWHSTMPPGTNDRPHLAACAVNQIGVIVSSDRALAGAPGIRRADPLDDAAVARLLG